MNDLGSSVLKVMESSSLGRMSIYVLSKQSQDLGIDIDNMTSEDIAKLASRLRSVLPFFLGDETEQVLTQIRKLNHNGAGVMT